MTSLTDIISNIRKAMEGVQLVSWHTGHLCRDDHSCDCRYIFADNDTMGAIASVHVGDDDNDAPPVEEAKANQRFIAACNPANIAALLDALEKAEADMRTIADTDPVDNMLDPQRPARIARLWLEAAKS